MLIVSNYHYIRNDFNTPYPSIFGVTPGQFKKQLLQLGKMGTFIRPSEFIQNPEHYFQNQTAYILLTFDDGLQEQFELAKPVLDDLGLEAFYFINTANSIEEEVSLVHQIHLLRSVVAPKKLLNAIHENTPVFLNQSDTDKASKHYYYDPPEAAELKYLLNFKLTYEEQEKIIRPLFDAHFDKTKVHASLYMNKEVLTILGKTNQLGSHSHRHLPLGVLSKESLEVELTTSKQLLEANSGQSIIAISYPYGNPESCTTQVAEVSEAAGYRFGFTMTRKANKLPKNHLLLHRFDCNDLPGGKNEKTTALCELPF